VTRLFGIAGVQMSVIPWDVEASVAKMTDALTQISRSFPWVQMVVFHELAVSGMVQFVSAPAPDSWQKMYQTIPGPGTKVLAECARKTGKWIVPGSMYETEDDTLYNTSIVISPQGEIVAKYRKMFPWLPYESSVKAGEQFCVFDVPDVGRFGLCICYDMWFPEVARTLVWMGAEVILHPTMTPTSDRVLELTLSQANAIFNQCYFIDINGVGPYGGGRSLLVDPDGRVLQEAGTNETILTELLDLDHVTRTREYGTIGLNQTLKQLRDCGHEFPLYQGAKQSEGFQQLGPLKFHR
jgi:predicted amidohydrolase